MKRYVWIIVSLTPPEFSHSFHRLAFKGLMKNRRIEVKKLKEFFEYAKAFRKDSNETVEFLMFLGVDSENQR